MSVTNLYTDLIAVQAAAGSGTAAGNNTFSGNNVHNGSEKFNADVSFFGVALTAQPAGAAQAAVSQTQTSLTDNSTGAVSTTLAAVTSGANAGSADVGPTKNAIASLAAELALVKADVAGLVALCNALRSALVTLGLIKGSA